MVFLDVCALFLERIDLLLHISLRLLVFSHCLLHVRPDFVRPLRPKRLRDLLVEVGELFFEHLYDSFGLLAVESGFRAVFVYGFTGTQGFCKLQFL